MLATLRRLQQLQQPLRSLLPAAALMAGSGAAQAAGVTSGPVGAVYNVGKARPGQLAGRSGPGAPACARWRAPAPACACRLRRLLQPPPLPPQPPQPPLTLPRTYRSLAGHQHQVPRGHGAAGDQGGDPGAQGRGGLVHGCAVGAWLCWPLHPTPRLLLPSGALLALHSTALLPETSSAHLAWPPTASPQA